MSDLHPELITDRVNRWLAFGDDDLRLARHALRMLERCPYRLVAYHAQQCVERYLKAWLVFRGVDFPHTHNIARLVELSGEDPTWSEVLHEAEELTPFAVTARYPGADEHVAHAEAERAIHIAERVRSAVRHRLESSTFRPDPPFDDDQMSDDERAGAAQSHIGEQKAPTDTPPGPAADEPATDSRG